MSYIDSYKEAFLHLPEGAAEAEVNAETHEITEISVEDGKIAEMQCSSQTVLFVRVSGEKTGYVYTEDLSEDAGEVLQKAYDNSFCSDRTQPDVMNRISEIRCYEKKDAAVKANPKIRQHICQNIGNKITDRKQ